MIIANKNGVRRISSAYGLSFCLLSYQFLNITKLRFAKYNAAINKINKAKNSTNPSEFNHLLNLIFSPVYKSAAPKTPAESPNLFFNIGVSTLSLKTK